MLGNGQQDGPGCSERVRERRLNIKMAKLLVEGEGEVAQCWQEVARLGRGN